MLAYLYRISDEPIMMRRRIFLMQSHIRFVLNDQTFSPLASLIFQLSLSLYQKTTSCFRVYVCKASVTDDERNGMGVSTLTFGFQVALSNLKSVWNWTKPKLVGRVLSNAAKLTYSSVKTIVRLSRTIIDGHQVI